MLENILGEFVERIAKVKSAQNSIPSSKKEFEKLVEKVEKAEKLLDLTENELEKDLEFLKQFQPVN